MPKKEALNKVSNRLAIIKKAEADLDIMSIEEYEEREKMLAHRASILEAELSRLSLAPTLSVEEVRKRLAKKYTKDSNECPY